MVEQSEFFIATPTDILWEIIAKSGRWKTLSEVDHSNSMMRASLESKLFGISDKKTIREHCYMVIILTRKMVP